MYKSKDKTLKIGVITFLLIIICHSIFGTISFKSFINFKALELIVAGVLLSTIISYSFETIIFTIHIIKSSFNAEIDHESAIFTLYEFAIKVKKDGALKIQSEILDHENDFIKSAMGLVCDYEKPDNIRDVLEKDIESRRNKLFKAYNVLKMISQVAPSFGLIGTLLGMVGLLSHIDNPKLIMANMSSALVSTLYGALIANFIAVPLMGRIKELIDKKTLEYRIITEGAILIAKNDSIRNVFDKMNVMLPDDLRFEYPKNFSERDYSENEITI
ncbi:motility protein A [Maledivibacter halophilus]|uniref:Chemotaxis protein MotA n=1 Tax=Maledivibacter halophilus TaxID=36842 RepID=A0A1T5J3L5_9FIRM|nr:MotA/TolQ/ExbB proton channel family protein [Maledivibacter halophilus]SKC46000.1 chemotaxis protein MotA [Maledivibacter halophilus]